MPIERYSYIMGIALLDWEVIDYALVALISLPLAVICLDVVLYISYGFNLQESLSYNVKFETVHFLLVNDVFRINFCFSESY